jgi:hypothetical protein
MFTAGRFTRKLIMAGKTQFPGRFAEHRGIVAGMDGMAPCAVAGSIWLVNSSPLGGFIFMAFEAQGVRGIQEC